MTKKIIYFVFLWLSVITPFAFAKNHQQIFDHYGVKGSTTIYNYQTKKWFFTSKADANRATLPASTFKILNSLIALENKAVKDETEIIKWDGEVRSFGGTPIDAWNRDNNLRTAYQNSTVWFYVEIAKRLNRDLYCTTLLQCKYGNNDLSEKGIDFWNYGNFAITPKNQIKFLIKLYENKLPFSATNLNKVKNIMISEKTDDYIFRDKTGWTNHKGQDIGWWVGYVEVKQKVYFFATRLTKDVNTPNPNFSAARKEITKAILKEQHIIEIFE